MTNPLTIRTATEADAPAVAALVQGVSHYFLADPSGAGADAFQASISVEAIAGYIKSPAFLYIVGHRGAELAGVAALKDNKHVYHLFVRPEFHRQGVAQRLWQHLRHQAVAAGNPGTFTVNSSLYAVPVYARFGFIATAAEQTRNGIQYQPMQLSGSAP